MLFLFWIVMAVAVAVAASVKGYNWFLWFLYGFALWPVALVHILVRRRADEIAVRPAPARQDFLAGWSTDDRTDRKP